MEFMETFQSLAGSTQLLHFASLWLQVLVFVMPSVLVLVDSWTFNFKVICFDYSSVYISGSVQKNLEIDHFTLHSFSNTPCVCMWTCVVACTHIYERGGRKSTLGTFFNWSLSYFCIESVSLNPEFMNCLDWMSNKCPGLEFYSCDKTL